MDTVLNYMTTQVITMCENNTKQHMIEYVERFVNVRWEKKETTDIIKGLMQTSKERQEAAKAKVKKYRNILQQRKEENKVENKTVQQWEAELGEHNRKTMNFEHFKTYVNKKMK